MRSSLSCFNALSTLDVTETTSDLCHKQPPPYLTSDCRSLGSIKRRIGWSIMYVELPLSSSDVCSSFAAANAAVTFSSTCNHKDYPVSEKPPQPQIACAVAALQASSPSILKQVIWSCMRLDGRYQSAVYTCQRLIDLLCSYLQFPLELYQPRISTPLRLLQLMI